MNNYQQRYWQELYDLKVHTTYLEVYLLRTEKVDRLINGFLAIASSGSIASWVIWEEYQFVWASIIVFSQLVNAIKQFLPYSSRMKNIGKALREMESLSISYEKKWFYIAEGKKTEEEINSLRFEIKEKKSQIMTKSFGSNVLPNNEKVLKEAEELVQQNIQNYYQ